MKKVFIIFILFLSLQSLGAEMLDVDYDFIDKAFDGIRPVSDKEFNDTINRLTPQPVGDGFGAKLKTFLFGRKYGPSNTNNNLEQSKKMDIYDEKQIISEISNGIFYIKLIVSIVGEDGKVIPVGNYKIQEKIINNEPNLVFLQGLNTYGMLKLRDFVDNKKNENDISYSRVDIISDNTVRVVYSTISKTQCAYAKVYLQNGI